MSKEQVLEQALGLDYEDRADLARRLLDGLEDLSPEEYEQAWLEVAVRRAEELRSGKAKGIPVEEVLRDAGSRLG
ncbi:putative addiction module component [Calidithermus terrae]|uniref:Putative addiction module component n=1 Tax=Calidithermus terrae TaxID=1408545 RepID=A0A399F7G9_9DEIN|nr:addiction module protein [Calidithermus terrae]RIH90842.1 putative addiction module component [Calidithermus terrae]